MIITIHSIQTILCKIKDRREFVPEYIPVNLEVKRYNDYAASFLESLIGSRSLYRFTTLFFFLIHTSLFAQNIEITGAGSSQANGIYEVTGTSYGIPSYTMIGNPNKIIVWNSYSWEIIENSLTLYEGYDWSNNASTPDLVNPNDWYTYFGTPPSPTVTISGPNITYSALVFIESTDGDGTLANSLNITFNGFAGDFFTGVLGENYLTNGKATLSNLPAGFTAQLLLSTANQLTFKIFGSANAHTTANNISNLTLQINNSAFNGGNAAAVSNSLKNDLSVQFRNKVTVCASGCNYTTIQAAINALGTGNIVQLSAQTYTETNITINGKEIIILGAGTQQTIIQAHLNRDAASNRVIYIDGGELILKDLTVRHGKSSTNQAGGIQASSACALEMYRCAIVDNVTNYTNGNVRSEGGGIGMGLATKLIVSDCIIANNVIRKNGTVEAIGGGLYARLDCQNSVFEITNTSFSGNSIVAASSTTSGGGLALGDLIANNSVINNCTFTGNSAGTRGGGIAFLFDENNTHILQNSIIFGNTAASGADIYRHNGIINGLNNIIGNAQAVSGNAINGTNSNNSDSNPLIQTLANNGGSTQTHAIAAGSPAIDAAGTGATATDQRGFHIQGTRDLGAFELNGLDAMGYAVWTGAESNSWSEQTNWNPLSVPTSSSNVLIPASSNNPISSGSIEISELILQSDAALTLQNNHTLLIDNNLQNNGSITLQATDASNYAQLKFNGAYSGSGMVTQQQNLNAGWNLISSSMNATEASHFGNVGTNAIGATSNTRNLYSWDGAKYVNIPDNLANITPGTGYFGFVGTLGFQAAAGLTNFTGTPNTSVLSTSLSFSNPAGGITFTINGSTSNQGWNLIGNPFTCALDIEALATNNSSNIEGAIYIYNASGPSYTSRSAGSPGNRYIAPLQAFWVKANGTNPTIGPSTWTMAEFGTISQSPTRLKGQSNPIEDYFVIDVAESNNADKKDQLVFSIAPSATDDFDSELDARKFLNGAGMPSLYSLVNGEGMAVNSITYVVGQTKSMDLVFKSNKHSENYEISLNLSYLTNNFAVFLEDKAQNVFHNLVLDGSYAFTHDTNFTDRFVLHFNQSTVDL